MICPNCGATLEQDLKLVSRPPDPPPPPPPPPPPAPVVFGLKVSGNKILDGSGKPAQLRGVNRMGTEYACIGGWAFSPGPNDAAVVQALKSWKVNAVRIPMNEDCWLGINGSPAAYSGNAYQQYIKDAVALLVASSIYPILDLHWNAAGTAQSKGQQQMADRDHALDFWRSVATAFKGNDAVIFDLYNEPHDIPWTTWRDGLAPWAGMQEMANVVRATGATNVLLCSGNAWGNDLSGWLANKPLDANVIAGWHGYDYGTATTNAARDAQIAPVAAQVPVLLTEFNSGSRTVAYSAAWLTTLLDWCESHGVGYFPWTWTVNPGAVDALITDYAGTPTTFGTLYKNYLAVLT